MQGSYRGPPWAIQAGRQGWLRVLGKEGSGGKL